jgi:hypothetical protein
MSREAIVLFAHLERDLGVMLLINADFSNRMKAKRGKYID